MMNIYQKVLNSNIEEMAGYFLLYVQADRNRDIAKQTSYQHIKQWLLQEEEQCQK